MILDHALAFSYRLVSRVGIDGLVLFLLFSGCVYGAIVFLSRHEPSPPKACVVGVIATALFSTLIGAAVGQDVSMLGFALLFCGVGTFISSGPFLEFWFVQRFSLAVMTPVFYLLAEKGGDLAKRLILETILS